MLTFPTDTRIQKNQMRGAIGRLVTFYSEISTACPVCGSTDGIIHKPIDTSCLTCSGLGYIITYSGTSISGHITWGKADSLQWAPGGQYFQGDCGVQVEYTEDNLATVDSSVYVVVDNKKVMVTKKILRGVPELDRMLLDCIELEKEG